MSDAAQLSQAAAIVAAYIQHNRVAAGELANLIASVHRTLASLNEPPAPVGPVRMPPAKVRKSITPDRLMSFEDGKPYKTLKRHLNARGLTPEAYRAKWGLPADYPMVAPSYAQRRSEVARSMGLGTAKGPRGAKQRSKFDR